MTPRSSTELTDEVLAAARHAYDIGGSMGLGLWRTRHKQAGGGDLSYGLLVRAVRGEDADEATTVGYALSGVAHALWDRDARHLVDQARQIEEAIAAKKWATALWACGAIRDEAARAEWRKRIEEARQV